MKKIIALMIAMVLVMSLAACGGGSKSSEEKNDESVSSDTESKVTSKCYDGTSLETFDSVTGAKFDRMIDSIYVYDVGTTESEAKACIDIYRAYLKTQGYNNISEYDFYDIYKISNGYIRLVPGTDGGHYACSVDFPDEP